MIAPAEKFDRIFGTADRVDGSNPGRSRKCRVCGGWHRLDAPWPHNCRGEAPRRNWALQAPMLAPVFEPFRTGAMDDAAVIGSRNEKREYMASNDLVEYDEGIGRRTEWVEEYDLQREIVADLKRFHETDPINLPPDLKAQPMDESGSLADGTEIDTGGIEVIK